MLTKTPRSCSINISKLRNLLIGKIHQVGHRRTVDLLRLSRTSGLVPQAILPRQVQAEQKRSDNPASHADKSGEEARDVRGGLLGKEELGSDDIADAVSDESLAIKISHASLRK